MNLLVETAQVAYNVLLPIVLITGIGFVLGRGFRLDPRPLSNITIYALLPCLFFKSLYTTDIPIRDIALTVLLVWLLAILMAVLGIVVTRVYPNFQPDLRAAFIMCIVLVNTGVYGLPFVEFAFGSAGVERGVIIAMATSTVTNTLGIFLASPTDGHPLRTGLRNMLRVPMLYVIVVAFALNIANGAPPEPIAEAIDLLSRGAIGVMLIVLGLQLSGISLRTQALKRLLQVGTASVLKLVVPPAIVFGLTVLLGIGGLTQQVAILQLSMPTAVSAVVIATEFGSDAHFATEVTFLSTVLSILSLSILLVLVS